MGIHTGHNLGFLVKLDLVLHVIGLVKPHGQCNLIVAALITVDGMIQSHSDIRRHIRISIRGKQGCAIQVSVPLWKWEMFTFRSCSSVRSKPFQDVAPVNVPAAFSATPMYTTSSHTEWLVPYTIPHSFVHSALPVCSSLPQPCFLELLCKLFFPDLLSLPKVQFIFFWHFT